MSVRNRLRTRRIALAAVGALVLLVTTGCWDTQELDTRALVVAIGIDLPEDVTDVPILTAQGEKRMSPGPVDEDNARIVLTFLIAKPEQSARTSQGGGAGGDESSFFVIGAEGNTFLDAIERAKSRLSRSIYFGHLQVILISEGVARTEWSSLMGEVIRDPDVSSLVLLGVAKDQTAREVLQARPPLEKQTAGFVQSFNTKDDVPGQVNFTALWEFFRDLHVPGRESGAMGISATDDQVEINGLAAFRGASLVGWLDPHETEGFNFLTNQFVGGTVVTRYKDEPVEFIAARNMKVSTDVTPSIQNGKVAFQIKVRAEGDVGRKAAGMLRGRPEEFSQEEMLIGARIKELVEAGLKRMQLLETDIADLGHGVRNRFPEVWRANRWDQHWNEAFRQATMEVEVEVRLRRKGLTK